MTLRPAIPGKKVAVIGLGYVGLPLALSAAKRGWNVLGIDNDEYKVDCLRQGRSYIEDVDDKEIIRLNVKGVFQVSQNLEQVAEAQIVILCLPTPIKNKRPDLSELSELLTRLANHLAADTLIVSESSSYPGTLRELIAPLILTNSREKFLHFAFSPERIDPGNLQWGIESTPRLLSGLSKTAIVKAKEFYESICKSVIVVDSPEIAEAAKMFENAFRQVNIAFVNEFARYCNRIGIEAHKVLDSAASKPYGFMKFSHGAGVGGHCIPVDPYYLSQHARDVGFPLSIIDLANEINEDQVNYVAKRAKDLLDRKSKNHNILVIGVGYKPGTRDTRESPGLKLIENLKKDGKNVTWFDPMVESVTDVAPDDGVQEYDLVIQVQFHAKTDYSLIFNRTDKILDCSNMLESSSKVVRL